MSMTMHQFAGQEPKEDTRISFKCEICGEYRDEAEGVFKSVDNLTCCKNCKIQDYMNQKTENWEETGKEI